MGLPKPPTPESLSDFYWQRADWAGIAWLLLMLEACFDNWLRLA